MLFGYYLFIYFIKNRLYIISRGICDENVCDLPVLYISQILDTPTYVIRPRSKQFLGYIILKYKQTINTSPAHCILKIRYYIFLNYLQVRNNCNLYDTN